MDAFPTTSESRHLNEEECIDKCDDDAYAKFYACIIAAEKKYDRCLKIFTRSKSKCIVKKCIKPQSSESVMTLLGELVLSFQGGVEAEESYGDLA